MSEQERKSILAELIAYAQDGFVLAIFFLFGEGGKLISNDLGVPYHFVLTMALQKKGA